MRQTWRYFWNCCCFDWPDIVDDFAVGKIRLVQKILQHRFQKTSDVYDLSFQETVVTLVIVSFVLRQRDVVRRDYWKNRQSEVVDDLYQPTEAFAVDAFVDGDISCTWHNNPMLGAVMVHLH